MNIEALTTETKEIMVEGHKINVSVNLWSNYEGCNVMVCDDDLSLRMAGAFRWEELDVILVALTAARGA
jgi:hypothetical protein